MKLTAERLRNIIKEEMSLYEEYKLIKESKKSSNRVIEVTPGYLNKIIKEEYEYFKKMTN
jgi:hypothetical protein